MGDGQFQETVDIKKQEFLKNLQDIHQNLMMFKPYEQQINQQTDLDLMFIMDCTGSMGMWIKECLQELKTIIDYVKNQFNNTLIRISFIGYRDHSDRGLQFCIQPFTNNVEQIKDFIKNNALALGGGDTPEDIAGAFEHALNQQWQAKARYCILVTDSPCHGKKYHDCDDNYPEGDPQKRDPEQQIKQFAQKDIQFFAIKIDQKTNKMFNILSVAYQQVAAKPISFGELGTSTQQFGFYIACTVSATIAFTQIKQAINLIEKNCITQDQQDEESIEQQMESQKIIVKYDLDFTDYQQQIIKGKTYQAIAYTFFIVKDKYININWKKPLLQQSEITTNLTICQQPFSKGAQRYAFYAQDNILEQKMVVKLPIEIDETYKIELMKKDLESIFICQHIVNGFNDKIISIIPDTRLLLNFVHCFIYELRDEKAPYKFYYAENLIEGKYQKYNNNAGWHNSNVNESSLISQAFSHYSWQITLGYLMIVDLQGVTGILTDPQIHCRNKQRFGKGNLGIKGILMFFNSHQCNHYCKELQLLNPKEFESIPKNFDFFEDTIKRPKDLFEKVHVLCDLCRQPFEILANILYNKSIESKEKYCKTCDNKRITTMKQGNCIDCGDSFQSSQYWFLMKRTDFPVRCSNCRLQRREKLRKELEKKDI